MHPNCDWIRGHQFYGLCFKTPSKNQIRTTYRFNENTPKFQNHGYLMDIKRRCRFQGTVVYAGNKIELDSDDRNCMRLLRDVRTLMNMFNRDGHEKMHFFSLIR